MEGNEETGTKTPEEKKRLRIRMRCLGLVELAPSRKSMTPFCAYYGPNGETCSATRMLATVWTLPGIPPYAYMACLLHYAAVQQQVQAFLDDLEQLARQV
jgi:hypothetical protein